MGEVRASDILPGDSGRDTQRERVRRLVLRPLAESGMRFPVRTEASRAADTLNRICDELSYASDDTLRAVQAWARANGDGSQRCFFPPVVGFIGTAHAYQPRALEEIPVIASWFGSRAGPAARDAGRLVAEFLFLQKYLRPPTSDRERALVDSKAAEHGRRLELATDRIQRGVDPGPDERAFLAWHRDIEGRALALVTAGEARREE